MADQLSNPQELYEWQKPKRAFQFGRVMNRSFSGLFKNLKPIFLAIALITLISTIVSLPVYVLDLSDPVAAAQTPAYLVITTFSGLLGVFFMMFICVFTDHMAFAKFTNRPAGFRYVFLRALKLTIPILFIVTVYFISSYIGMIFFIVPGIIISVGWAVIGPTYVHEETSLFGSFGRSWELTRGYKWWVWLATIVMSFMAMIFFFVLAGIMSAVTLTNMSDPGMVAGFTPTQFLTGLVFSMLTYLAFALYASFTTALYTELRELKEGPLAEEMSAVFD